MTRRRWIADEVSGERAVLVGAQAAHLARVLHARVGQEFDIAAGGRVRCGRVVSVAPDRVEFELGEEVQVAALPDITLVLAIFKFDRMEWVIEKVTELGVARIVPLIASRTGSHLVSAASKRAQRWQRIAREASQQARRGTVPEITNPVRVKDVLRLTADRRIVLSESEQGLFLKQAAACWKHSLALAIGPEGGWAAEEAGAFREAGWAVASLGPTILRAETAAIAAVSIAIAEMLSSGHLAVRNQDSSGWSPLGMTRIKGLPPSG